MKSEIVEVNETIDKIYRLMKRYKILMNKVFDMLGFVDITFSENPVKIKGVSEITGNVWELPLWEQKGTKFNFYRYPELEEFYLKTKKKRI